MWADGRKGTKGWQTLLALTTRMNIKFYETFATSIDKKFLLQLKRTQIESFWERVLMGLIGPT